MTSPENQGASMQPDEAEAAMLRITISEFAAPFSMLTPEEYKKLEERHVRHLARSAQNLTEIPREEPATNTNENLYGYLEELRLSDPSQRQSQSRRLSRISNHARRAH